MLLAAAGSVLFGYGGRAPSVADSASPSVIAAIETETALPPALQAQAAAGRAVQPLSIPAPIDEFQESESWQRELRRSAAAARAATASRTAAPTAFTARPLAGSVTVPILMYHHIDEAGPSADAIRRDLSVSPAKFADQLAYLASNGYHPITLSQLLDHLATSRPLPPKPIVLTFDDGYLDNYTQALALLRARGFTGTFFLIIDYVGHGEYMSWDQAREMQAAGMEIGSHTLDHPDLTQLSAERLARQLTESRRALESQLGAVVSALCYPSGRYSTAVVAAVARAGYTGAVTTVYGNTHSAGDSLDLSRVRISGKDTLPVFAAKIGGPPPIASQAPQAPAAKAP